MKGLSRSGSTGLWEARKAIPDALRPLFGKREFKAALNTNDENEAIRVGAPLLADWSDQIEAAKGKVALAATPIRRQAIDRDCAYLAIQRWKSQRIKDALTLAFNGELEAAPRGFSDGMLAHVKLVGDLRDGDWRKVADFDAQLSAALNSQRMMCDPLHPAIPAMRAWFADAMATVEHKIMEYRKGNLSDAPEAPAAVRPALSEPPVLPPVPVPIPPRAGMKLLDLFDRWEASKGHKEKRHRGYVIRLKEFLGDPDVADIRSLQLADFLVELRRFPNTKRDISDLSFLEAIEQSQKRADYKTLHVKTVWNWTVVYKAMFEWAVDNEIIGKNPAAKMMRKPSASESAERDPYEDEDIKAIFSTPLFQGFSGPASTGYRKAPGEQVVRDHKYWLPLFALFHGVRVEEIAAARVDEFRVRDGIDYLDLTKRPVKRGAPRRVKNSAAQREVPLHKKIIELGFLNYLKSVPKDGFAFPEIGSESKSADAFSGWWGLWCDANADKPGVGIADPNKVFHSFRHTWKRAARENPYVKEDLSDLISGHTEGNRVARGYGAGANLRPLKATIDLITFPTFPL